MRFVIWKVSQASVLDGESLHTPRPVPMAIEARDHYLVSDYGSDSPSNRRVVRTADLEEFYDNYGYAWFFDIHGVEDIVRLSDSIGKELIINGRTDPPQIQIYDDYNE